MTKEEILEKYIGAPIPLSGEERATRIIELAMDEYAKKQAAAFTNWTLSGLCMYDCTDEDQWISVDSHSVNITTEELYNIFIEQQNKE